jgi:DNA-binding transcriptional MerR regulator
MESRMSIGEVAAATGLSVHTLRLYEREDLLIDPVRRDSSGNRSYDADDVTWLRNCALLRSSGMSLEVIREFVSLVRQGPGTEEARLHVLEQHLSRIDRRRTEIEAAQRLVTEKIASYREHMRAGSVAGLWSTERT